MFLVYKNNVLNKGGQRGHVKSLKVIIPGDTGEVTLNVEKRPASAMVHYYPIDTMNI